MQGERAFGRLGNLSRRLIVRSINMLAMPSTMICLYPSAFVADRLMIRDPEPPESPALPGSYDSEMEASVDVRRVYPWEMHITLLYFEDVGLEQIGGLIDAVRSVVTPIPVPSGSITGIGEFGWGEGGYSTVALVDSKDLIPLRQRIIDALPAGLEPSDTHGFLPHITLAYSWIQNAIVVDGSGVLGMEMVFPEISVVFGYNGVRTSIPFTPAVTAKTGSKKDEIVDGTFSSVDSDSVLLRVTTEGKVQTTIKSTAWPTAYIESLPDSAFLYVAPGGVKVGEKTVPSSLRTLPYRNAAGEVDHAHLEASIRRLQTKTLPGLSEANRTALIDFAESLLPENSRKEGKRLSGGMKDKLSSAIGVLKGLLSWADYSESDDEDDAMKTAAFRVYKTADGTDRWVSLSSTAFIDREREIVSTKALEDAVLIADQLPSRGPLMLWHTPGTEIGVCDFQGVEGRFLIESGTFLDTPMAQQVKKALMKSPIPLGVSIGFSHPATQPDAEGVFHNIKINERSVCPLDRAANPFTAFTTLTGGVMDDARREWFKSILGTDKADEILASTSNASKELEGLFVHKALTEPGTTTDPAPDAQGEQTPEATADPATPEATDKTAEVVAGVAELLREAITPLVNAAKATDTIIATLLEQNKALEARIAGIETAQKTAAPRMAAVIGARATEDEGNVVTDEIAAKVAAAAAEKVGNVSPVAPYLADILRVS